MYQENSLLNDDDDDKFRVQLNSTVIDNGEEHGRPTNELRLSPIVAESDGENEGEQSLSNKRLKRCKLNTITSKAFKSPFRLSNIKTTLADDAGYSSRSVNESNDASLLNTSHFSTPLKTKVSKHVPTQNEGSVDISISSLTGKSIHPFDSLLLKSIHKKTFSPSIVFSSVQSNEEGENSSPGRFWDIDQIAILKPAEITQEEIDASSCSPNPEFEQRIQQLVSDYWKNSCVMPSPDGPLPFNFPIGVDLSNSSASKSKTSKTQPETPLCNVVRNKEALRAAYATSSPKQRPRRRIGRAKNCRTQTELTIPPNADVDFKKLLGRSCIYQEEEEMQEEEFETSVNSNYSTRRRLFDDENSFGSCDANESMQFDDGLSPVRANEDEHFRPRSSSSASSCVLRRLKKPTKQGSRSRSQTPASGSQSADASMFNECMVNSEDSAVSDENEAHEAGFSAKEKLMPSVFVAHAGMDLSVQGASVEANSEQQGVVDAEHDEEETPQRREDLDFTPRRAATRAVGLQAFLLELSPITPNPNFEQQF